MWKDNRQCETWKPTMKDELIAGIQAFWKTVTAEICEVYQSFTQGYTDCN